MSEQPDKIEGKCACAGMGCVWTSEWARTFDQYGEPLSEYDYYWAYLGASNERLVQPSYCPNRGYCLANDGFAYHMMRAEEAPDE